MIFRATESALPYSMDMYIGHLSMVRMVETENIQKRDSILFLYSLLRGISLFI